MANLVHHILPVQPCQAVIEALPPMIRSIVVTMANNSLLPPGERKRLEDEYLESLNR